MPGKVNPVIPEVLTAMARTQCVGLDSAIALAGQSGNFQLNVMLPLVADNLLQMIGILARACAALAGRGGIGDFSVRRAELAAAAARNPILATTLAPELGYELTAQIVKRALAEQRPIIEVAAEMSKIDRARLEQLLDPRRQTDAAQAGLEPDHLTLTPPGQGRKYRSTHEITPPPETRQPTDGTTL